MGGKEKNPLISRSLLKKRSKPTWKEGNWSSPSSDSHLAQNPASSLAFHDLLQPVDPSHNLKQRIERSIVSSQLLTCPCHFCPSNGRHKPPKIRQELQCVLLLERRDQVAVGGRLSCVVIAFIFIPEHCCWGKLWFSTTSFSGMSEFYTSILENWGLNLFVVYEATFNY